MTGNVFFTSDLHLFHQKVAELRGFTTVEEHNEAIKAAWIKTVLPGDQVWLLGDNQAAHEQEALAFIAGLPGVKHLVAGNHDPVHSMHRNAHRKQRSYLDVFESVQVFARRKIAGREVLLSHFPYGPKVMNATWLQDEWRETEYPGYSVSPDGEVRGRFGRTLKPYVMQSGYHQVSVNDGPGDAKSVKAYVHRLVAIAYHGKPSDPALQVAHNDGDPGNNRASNLRWTLPQENADDKQLHGTTSHKGLAGEDNGRAILSAQRVAQIRVSKESYSALALAYGVSKSTIADIKHDRSWVRRPQADHTVEPRYMQYRLPNMGEWLLHGHTHSDQVWTSRREIHVGVDAWGLTPVPIHKIVDLMNEADMRDDEAFT